MERTIFNPAQLEILDLMSYVDNEDTLNEIKDMLSRYFAQKAEADIDKLWEEGKINDLVIENWKHEHLRPPIIQKNEKNCIRYQLFAFFST